MCCSHCVSAIMCKYLVINLCASLPSSNVHEEENPYEALTNLSHLCTSWEGKMSLEMS